MTAWMRMGSKVEGTRRDTRLREGNRQPVLHGAGNRNDFARVWMCRPLLLYQMRDPRCGIGHLHPLREIAVEACDTRSSSRNLLVTRFPPPSFPDMHPSSSLARCCRLLLSVAVSGFSRPPRGLVARDAVGLSAPHVPVRTWNSGETRSFTRISYSCR